MRAFCFFLSLLLIPVTLLLAIFSFLGLLAPYVSPAVFTLPAFINLFLPILLLVNLVLLLYWLVQKSRWIFVPVISILLNFNYILSVFQISFHTDPTNEKNIRIATYNVGGFRSWEKNDTQFEIAQYMRDQNADIVCFQEYKSTPQVPVKKLSARLGLPHYATNYLSERGYASYGSAIFSKYPIVAYNNIRIPSETNDAMWADLKIGNDTIRVFNCHLQTTNFSRKQKHLRQQLQDGQFNSQTFVPVYAELKQNFKRRAIQSEILRQQIDASPYLSYSYHTVKVKLTDSFRESGQGYGYTFRGLKKILRIDFILYSPLFKGSHYRSPSVFWSDHKPVFTDLSLKSDIF